MYAKSLKNKQSKQIKLFQSMEITDQVALPERVADKGKVMRQMDVGQSFSVQNGEENEVRHLAWRLFHRENKETGKPISEKRFTVKRDPTDILNYRCWREQ